MSDCLIHRTEHLTFNAIETSPGRFQAKQFIESLDDIGLRHFRVATAVLDTSTAIGRPPAGRANRVAGSAPGLFELRITPLGRRGPHARLLYIRERDTIWIARGLTKRERLARADIQLAEKAVARRRTDRSP
jgi:hypothetical protein